MQILGIDIGGSWIKAAPVDTARGALLAERTRIATPRPATPAAIAAGVAELIARLAWTGPVGCGLPAVVQQGIVRTAANIDAAWIGTDTAHLFSETQRGTVTVINDADAAGLAEMRFGAGRQRSGTVIMVTLGTGLGTALFRDGVLLPNTELGHLQLAGMVAEHYASAATRTKLDLSYADWARRLDLYLARLRELFWPDLFILGGEISKDHAQFVPLLATPCAILPAALGNDAGIIGAALAAAG